MVRGHVRKSVRETHGDAFDVHTRWPTWGNWPDDVDRYDCASARTMPFAGAVHAKVNDIDVTSESSARFDHAQCLKIARDAGYDGYLGIEYEGADEPVEGIRRGASVVVRTLLSSVMLAT